MNLHWKKHKKECTRSKVSKPTPPPPTTTKPAPNSSSSSSIPYVAGEKLPRGLKKPVNPDLGWKRLSKGTWFHNRPESDVYKLLIDVYRLRMDDRWDVAKAAEPGSLYVRGATDGAAGFRTFLDKAARVRSDKGYRLLPDWWSKEKRSECEALGADATQWTSLSRKVGKWDVHKHYDDMGLAMQLRSLAETIYNSSVDGRKIAKIPDELFERDPELDYYGAYDDLSDSDDTDSMDFDYDEADLRF
ncbi:mynd domain-containing protein [Colletotrichum karsti]|uniref:Mynd domain-containing protein n=1 Tax=Colletotrichum karsti TaxID=1095194 RepID=A0A9P6I586_9PEZI|nr:mynd domain-containing protein [Colletotrichum karsti]KAF9876633.1 mynd domain-containing protein [Colletotrichum karsti]